MLFLAFAVALATNVRRGRTDLECGCFGESRARPLSWRTVVVRVGLALASVVITLAPPRWEQDGLEYAFVFTLGWAGAWILLRALSVMTQESGGARR